MAFWHKHYWMPIFILYLSHRISPLEQQCKSRSLILMDKVFARLQNYYYFASKVKQKYTLALGPLYLASCHGYRKMAGKSRDMPSK